MSLDLARIDELDIANEADQIKLAGMVHDAYLESKPILTNLSRIWEQSVLFYEGNQWISYSETNKTWSDIPVTQFNDFIPRPVTNLMNGGFQTVASLFCRNKPKASVYSNRSDGIGEMRSSIAEALLDVKFDLDKEQEELITDVLIAMLFGTCYRKDFWDVSKGDLIKVKTEDGPKVMRSGDTAIAYFTPLEVIPDIQNKTYYIESQIVKTKWVKDSYNQTGNGYTGLSDKVVDDRNLSTTMMYRERLRASTGIGGVTAYTATGSTKGQCMKIEAYIQPTTRYPNGLMVVECGKVPLFISESPYYVQEIPDSWHPYSEWKWVKSPTRYHGISLGEIVVPSQKRLNKIDSFIELAMMTTSSPMWTMPKGCGVDPALPLGRPGIQVHYNPVGANGATPQRLAGIPLDASLFKRRDETIEEIHNLIGDNQILSGENPSGVNAVGSLNILMEQSFNKFSPQIQAHESFLCSGQQKKLLCMQKFYKNNPPAIFEKIKRSNPDIAKVAFDDFFNNADVVDNFDISIESGSALPRSKVGEQQQLMDLQGRGLLGDVTPANPIANQEFLQKFGISKFAGITNNQVKKAKYVVDVLNQINRQEVGPDLYPPFQPFEDPKMQVDFLTQEMMKPSFTDPMQVFKAKLAELQEVQNAINQNYAPQQPQQLPNQDQQQAQPDQGQSGEPQSVDMSQS